MVGLELSIIHAWMDGIMIQALCFIAILTLIEDSDEPIETMTHRGWTRLYLDAMEVSHG